MLISLAQSSRHFVRVRSHSLRLGADFSRFSEILGPSMTILREFHGAVLEACNIYIYIECHPRPVTASNRVPCLEKTLQEHKQIRFSWLPIFSIPRIFGIFGKRGFKLCSELWVCDILDLPFWIPCCILCVALSKPMNFWMSLQWFWFARVAYDFVSGEKCILCPIA